jgi:hypothetical protein
LFVRRAIVNHWGRLAACFFNLEGSAQKIIGSLKMALAKDFLFKRGSLARIVIAFLRSSC